MEGIAPLKLAFRADVGCLVHAGRSGETAGLMLRFRSSLSYPSYHFFTLARC
jgi:hypothetical protein